jgi:hypothetical protein
VHICIALRFFFFAWYFMCALAFASRTVTAAEVKSEATAVVPTPIPEGKPTTLWMCIPYFSENGDIINIALGGKFALDGAAYETGSAIVSGIKLEEKGYFGSDFLQIVGPSTVADKYKGYMVLSGYVEVTGLVSGGARMISFAEYRRIWAELLKNPVILALLPADGRMGSLPRKLKEQKEHKEQSPTSCSSSSSLLASSSSSSSSSAASSSAPVAEHNETSISTIDNLARSGIPLAISGSCSPSREATNICEVFIQYPGLTTRYDSLALALKNEKSSAFAGNTFSGLNERQIESIDKILSNYPKWKIEIKPTIFGSMLVALTTPSATFHGASMQFSKALRQALRGISEFVD